MTGKFESSQNRRSNKSLPI